MSHETLHDQSDEKPMDSFMSLIHATRLARAIERRKQVSALLEENEGESRQEVLSYTVNGKVFSQKVDITPELHRGITQIILQEREALIQAGFPRTAEYIAPQNPETKEVRVIFMPDMRGEAA